MKRKVSVIIPTYNREGILGRSIESVLNQTYTEFELIIVDDGSTDNTRQLVENIHDDRISYYYVKNNSGAAAARNYGIERAEGEYIAFQDSDDYWHSDKLEKQMKVMESNPDIGFVFHAIRYDGDDNSRTEASSDGKAIEIKKKINKWGLIKLTRFSQQKKP